MEGWQRQSQSHQGGFEFHHSSIASANLSASCLLQSHACGASARALFTCNLPQISSSFLKFSSCSAIGPDISGLFLFLLLDPILAGRLHKSISCYILRNA